LTEFTDNGRLLKDAEATAKLAKPNVKPYTKKSIHVLTSTLTGFI